MSRNSHLSPALVGITSILDLSGDARDFQKLAPRTNPSATIPEAIAGDLRAVGDTLRHAFLRYWKERVDTLPAEQRADLVRRVRAMLAADGSGRGEVEASRTPRKDVRPVRRRNADVALPRGQGGHSHATRNGSSGP